MTWVVMIAVAAVVAWLALGVRHIGAVSRGERIGKRDGTALLLIDLQEVFWGDDIYDAQSRARVEQAVRTASEAARAAGEPVIALRQEWSEPATRLIAKLTMKGRAVAGSPGVALAAPFRDLPTQVLVKRVQDGFETGELEPLLAKLGIGRLRIAGIDGEYCVAKTARAALNRGYEVALLTDGIATGHKSREPALLDGLTQAGATLA